MEQETKACNEVLLMDNKDRFVFIVTYPDIDSFYQKHKAAFWTPQEIDFSQDIRDWEGLKKEERYFLKHVLAFFAISDGIVNFNLIENFYSEIQLPEARAFLSFQSAMETIHSETYTLLLQTLVPDASEQSRLVSATESFPAIKKKAAWALRWTDRNAASFAERLVAFVAVEGIFFSGSFCAIFWLKSKGLLPGVCFSNELISRDEGLHCEFAIHLFNNYVTNKPSPQRVREILLSALDAEREFILEALPVSLIGMNSALMASYLEFVADRLLLQLGCDPEHHTQNPFPFMDMIALEGKTNFFEKRVSEYKRPLADTTDCMFEFDDQF
jgi:ribonucleoside-diphosphate reductase beta chain